MDERDLLASLPAAGPLLTELGSRGDVYVVGGAVRDVLLGGAPLDLDIAIEGDAIAVARELGGEIRVHPRFGTATVWRDGYVYDLASARRERYPRPGTLPVVEPADIREDLRRRDFTVNTFALALRDPRADALLAVPEARDDLAAGRLRVLHAASFRDDPTRLFRLARYAGRLGFAVEPDTEALVRQALADGALGTVSGERIGNELRLLAREVAAPDAFAVLRRLGIDAAIDPRFGIDDPQLGREALELLPADGRRDLLMLALAGRRLDPGALRDLLDRLGLPGGDRDTIAASVSSAGELARAMSGSRSPGAALDRAPLEAVALAGALGPREAARAWLESGRWVRLEIAGEDLLAAGVPTGPSIGHGLRAALAAKREGRAPDRDAELAVAVAAARDSLRDRA